MKIQSAPHPRMFFRLTKADETLREVSGVMVSEATDKVGEIFDYASSKPNFKAWSDEIAKATDGKSLGNVREMHQSVAVGKVVALDFDDDAKKISITAKIYDDSTWKKVEVGVLTGFSIGGKYSKKWTEGELTRYTAKPAEVSLVDNPCVPDAHFSLTRANGSTELVKAVGGVAQVWDCRKDGHRHAIKAEAIDCMGKTAGHRIGTSENTDPAEDQDAGAGVTAIPESDEELPETEEGDESGSGAGAEHDTSGKAKPVAMAGKSIDDQLAALTGMVAALAASVEKLTPKEAPVEKPTEPVVDKAAVEPPVAPVAAPAVPAEPVAAVAKIATPEAAQDLNKAFSERLDLLESNIGKAVEVIKSIGDRVLAMPAPARGVLRPVSKSHDTGEGAGEANEKAKKDATALDLIKEAFAKPSRTF